MNGNQTNHNQKTSRANLKCWITFIVCFMLDNQQRVFLEEAILLFKLPMLTNIYFFGSYLYITTLAYQITNEPTIEQPSNKIKWKVL